MSNSNNSIGRLAKSSIPLKRWNVLKIVRTVKQNRRDESESKSILPTTRSQSSGSGTTRTLNQENNNDENYDDQDDVIVVDEKRSSVPYVSEQAHSILKGQNTVGRSCRPPIIFDSKLNNSIKDIHCFYEPARHDALTNWKFGSISSTTDGTRQLQPLPLPPVLCLRSADQAVENGSTSTQVGKDFKEKAQNGLNCCCSDIELVTLSSDSEPEQEIYVSPSSDASPVPPPPPRDFCNPTKAPKISSLDGSSLNVSVDGPPIKRKRGRPRKRNWPNFEASPVPPPPPRDFCNPTKAPKISSLDGSSLNVSVDGPPIKRKRGRPRKRNWAIQFSQTRSSLSCRKEAIKSPNGNSNDVDVNLLNTSLQKYSHLRKDKHVRASNDRSSEPSTSVSVSEAASMTMISNSGQRLNKIRLSESNDSDKEESYQPRRNECHSSQPAMNVHGIGERAKLAPRNRRQRIFLDNIDDDNFDIFASMNSLNWNLPSHPTPKETQDSPQPKICGANFQPRKRGRPRKIVRRRRSRNSVDPDMTLTPALSESGLHVDNFSPSCTDSFASVADLDTPSVATSSCIESTGSENKENAIFQKEKTLEIKNEKAETAHNLDQIDGKLVCAGNSENEPDSMNDDEALSPDHYVVHRILQKMPKLDQKKNDFEANWNDTETCDGFERCLLFWHDYAFDECTAQKVEEIAQTDYLYQDFLVKEAGLDAIAKRLEQEVANGKFDSIPGARLIRPRKYDEYFRRPFLPYPSQLPCNYDRKDIEGQLESRIFVPRFGYWNIKFAELEWLRVLDKDAVGAMTPLYIENWFITSSRMVAPKFQFVMDNIFSDDAEIVFRELITKCQTDLEKRCRCQQCPCIGLCDFCKKIPYSERFKFENDLLKPAVVENPYAKNSSVDEACGKYVFGCSPRQCDCDIDCPNSVVERGRKVPLVVFYEPNIRGYGVRTLTNIKKGTYISSYVGKVITREEGQNISTTYQFDVGDDLIIDGQDHGNESRFFCHSCDPNMDTVTVYSESLRHYYYKTAFFSKRDIEAGEELNFDYHPSWSDGIPKGQRMAPCKCGTKKCRGFL